MAISILLADDHKIFRESLRLLLSQQPDLQVVAEASNGIEAIAQIERVKPNIAVLDVAMPKLNGLDALRQIKQRFPELRVIVLSSYNEEGYVIDALSHGAAAYVLKDQSVVDLVLAVRAAMAGYRYLSPPLSERALEIYLSANQREGRSLDLAQIPASTFTKREQQILVMIEQGLANPDIGQRLNISARTVETHRAHLMLKLGLQTRAELTQFARQQKSKLPHE
jgi:two-component system, NarL family, response regulator NreC